MCITFVSAMSSPQIICEDSALASSEFDIPFRSMEVFAHWLASLLESYVRDTHVPCRLDVILQRCCWQLDSHNHHLLLDYTVMVVKWCERQCNSAPSLPLFDIQGEFPCLWISRRRMDSAMVNPDVYSASFPMEDFAYWLASFLEAHVWDTRVPCRFDAILQMSCWQLPPQHHRFLLKRAESCQVV